MNPEVCSPSPRLFYAHRTTPHGARPAPLPRPPPPATALTFSARAVKGGLPGITSANRHLLQNCYFNGSRLSATTKSKAGGKRRERGRGDAPDALPSQGNSVPPSPSRLQSPTQNGDEETGAGAPTTIHLLRERALAGLDDWLLSAMGWSWPSLIGKHMLPPHSVRTPRESRKRVAIGYPYEARFLELALL